METKREYEALFALEFIKNIKDEVRSIKDYELGKIIDIAVDMVQDQPKEANEAMTLISRSEYEHYKELQRMYEEDNF